MSEFRILGMKQYPKTTDTPQADAILLLAFELGKAKWLLGFGDGKKIRRRSIDATDEEALLEEIKLVKQKLGLPGDAPVHSCYEAGRDGFWLHRFLVEQGIHNRAFDSASIEVNRRSKRAKTDRIDGNKLLDLLMRIVLFGQTTVCSILHVPTLEQGTDMRRQMAIANDQSMPTFIALIPMLVQVVGDFGFNGPLQHLLGPIAKGGFEQALTDLTCVEAGGFGCLPRGGGVHLGAFH